MKGINVIYTPEQFKAKGFDGEVAKYMKENKNTAIVGHQSGVDRHIISYSNIETLTKYCQNNPYSHRNIITVKDITGAIIEVSDIDVAIEQCKLCADSPFKMASEHTVGENHRLILSQLERIKQKQQSK